MTALILDIPKGYKDGDPLFEANLDDSFIAITEWALSVTRNTQQIAVDTFGVNYTLDNDGSGNRVLALVDAFAALASNHTITGTWSFGNNIKVLNGYDLQMYSDAGSTLKFLVDGDTGVIQQGGARHATWMNNIAIIRATTTNAGDSIKITGANGTALSATNYGHVTLLDPSTPGQLVTFSVTADVTILLTGAHWANDTLGDLTGGILRVLAINDNGTLRWGVAYLGGRNTLLTTDTNATQSNINFPEEVLCTAAVSSATNSCREIGYVRANFDDTGGAAENLWTIQTGVNDVVTGQSADGLWRIYNLVYTGYSVNPTTGTIRWTQIDRNIYVQYTQNTNGTSNATNSLINLPAKAARAQQFLGMAVYDNDANTTTPGGILTAVGSTTLELFKDALLNVWTNANGKGFYAFNICYEVGPTASFIE